MWRMENCHQKPHKLWLAFQVLDMIAQRQYDLVADHMHVAEFLPGMGTDTRRSMRRALDDLVGGTTVASSPAGMASAYSSNSTRAAHEKLLEAEQHAHLLLEMVARRDTHGEKPEILNEIAASCKSYRIRITEMITRASNNTDQPGMEQVMAKLLEANETLNKALEAFHTPGSLQATPKHSLAEGGAGPFAAEGQVPQEAAPASVPTGSPAPDAGNMLMDLLGGDPVASPAPAAAPQAIVDPFAPAAPVAASVPAAALSPPPAAAAPASNPFAAPPQQQPVAPAAAPPAGGAPTQEWNAFFDSRASQ